MKIDLSALKVSVNDADGKVGPFIEAFKLSQHILKRPWSPIIFKNNQRKQENFLFSDWAVLDFDNGYTLEEAQHDFCDCIHIIGTTKSHTDDKHRFRVCIPWEHRINNVEVFKHNQKRLISKYASDGQCKDAARFYYPCKEIVSFRSHGFRQEVSLDIPKKSEAVQYKKTGFSSAVTFFMKNVIVVGNRNVQIYQVAKDLFRIGLSQGTILDIVLRSPTYRDMKVDGDLLWEIKCTIGSAQRAVDNE